jgi:hypothetical protein
MNKSDKKVTKTVKQVKEIPSNPLPDNTTAAEYIRKRRTK